MKAIIFPGQGSQYTGMGRSFYDNFPQAKNTFSKIDDILGYELSEVCFEGDSEHLRDTSIQQLAILSVSLVAYDAFGVNTDIKYLSGLSLGEYSCLYAAGTVSLEDLLVLVRERAQAMQDAAKNKPATMFAVMGLERSFLQEEAAQGKFYIANVNSPQQIVISLAVEDKLKVHSNLMSKGARVVELQVSGGFHSPFMEPAKEHLASVISKINFNDAKIPIVSNVTAKPHTKSSEIKANLLEQLTAPVLWNDCVEFMAKDGVEIFFEVGPSKVLRGLMRKINPALKVINIEKKEDIEAVASSQGRL